MAMRTRIAYSQNFLRDSRLIASLIERSNISKNDLVFEIGAGSGIITTELLKHAQKVVAFELDLNLIKKLTHIFAGNLRLDLKCGNFLEFSLPNIPYKVFSNIPFNITSAIIKKLTFSGSSPLDSYLIVQKEAALKFSGKPFCDKNSLISALLYPWFEFRVVHEFKRGDFFPRPNVDSVLLEIKKRDDSLVNNNDKDDYRDFVVFAFSQFSPNILEDLEKVLGRQEILTLSRKLNFSAKQKPSEINFENWLDLFNLFLTKPQNKKIIVSGSYNSWIRQQENIEKIHRTRVDKNWRRF